MEKKLKYTSTLKTIPYLYLETKKAARLKLQGLQESDIVKAAVEDNIFQVNTESRKKEIASTIIRRLRVLNKPLLEKLVNGSIDTGKQIVLYTLLKSDRLFFEFMTEVYKEKLMLKEHLITDRDFNIFFQRKAEQDETVASWKEYTFYKLKQVYKRILLEAGFIKKHKKVAEIIRPLMEPEVIEAIKKLGDQAYLEAMLGEV